MAMKYYVIVFLSLLMTNFFGLTRINNTILLGLMIPFVIIEFSERSIFKWYIVIVFIGLCLSIISCNYFRGQPMLMTFKASVSYYYIFFYFVLKYLDVPISKMETSLMLLVIIFCGCYIVQYILFPTVIFSGVEDPNISADNIRIRLVGQGLSSLGYFFGLNKYLHNNKKLHYLFLAILCFGVIFLMGFRTMLVMISIFTFLLIIRVKGFKWNVLLFSLLGCGLFIVMLQIPVFAEKMNAMLDRQHTEVLSNKDYIRIVQLKYYTQIHFKSFWEYIYGSGMTYSTVQESSSYGRLMGRLPDVGIYWQDWGILGLSWMIGILAVISMIAYSIKAFLLKVPVAYYYIGIWFLYLVASSVTTMEFYREGNFIVQSIALYMVEKFYNEYKLRIE